MSGGTGHRGESSPETGRDLHRATRHPRSGNSTERVSHERRTGGSPTLRPELLDFFVSSPQLRQIS